MTFRFNKKYRIVALCVLTIVAIASVMMLRPIPQAVIYHNFADRRSFFGIPNFLNVTSNFPFVIIGMIGLHLIKKSTASRKVNIIYFFMFIGVLLTGIGSAYYHNNPNNDTLVFDRLPLTLVFMSLLSATLAEKIDLKMGFAMLFPLLIIGIAGVLWWHITELKGEGDLRPYILVQYYPIVFIPLILIFFALFNDRRGLSQLVWAVIWYVIAKLFEQFDHEIFSVTKFISGHTLKHLSAAVATWYLGRLFIKRHIFTTP